MVGTDKVESCNSITQSLEYGNKYNNNSVSHLEQLLQQQVQQLLVQPPRQRQGQPLLRVRLQQRVLLRLLLPAR